MMKFPTHNRSSPPGTAVLACYPEPFSALRVTAGGPSEGRGVPILMVKFLNGAATPAPGRTQKCQGERLSGWCKLAAGTNKARRAYLPPRQGASHSHS